MRYANAVWAHLGRRGAFLLFLALVDVVLAYSISQPLPLHLPASAFYQPFIAVMPLVWWSTWWLATAAITAVAAVVKPIRPVAFGAAALIKMVWAGGYLYGYLSHLPAYSRGYQSTVTFGAFALIVLLISGWRENGK